jgi:hypothetical protein
MSRPHLLRHLWDRGGSDLRRGEPSACKEDCWSRRRPGGGWVFGIGRYGRVRAVSRRQRRGARLVVEQRVVPRDGVPGVELVGLSHGRDELELGRSGSWLELLRGRRHGLELFGRELWLRIRFGFLERSVGLLVFFELELRRPRRCQQLIERKWKLRRGFGVVELVQRLRGRRGIFQPGGKLELRKRLELRGRGDELWRESRDAQRVVAGEEPPLLPLQHQGQPSPFGPARGELEREPD